MSFDHILAIAAPTFTFEQKMRKGTLQCLSIHLSLLAGSD
jgi:hypothetical protein